MRTNFLPFSPPLIGEAEIHEVVDTLRSDWISTGPKVARFQTVFAQYVDAPAALALNSCTAALHTALLTLGIGRRDIVLTTPMTFCATANVIEHVGARPVFVDVQGDTLNMDPIALVETIERLKRRPDLGRVRAVMPVHFAGHPCDLEAIRRAARAHDLAIVEDAAHALPARYQGRLIGSIPADAPPTAVAFSFYATKNLTTGEGGMLVGTPDFIDAARVVSLHGMSRDAWSRYSAEGSWFYEVTRPGFKYNMSDLQAAIGLHQLARLSHAQARRREIVHRYNQAFSSIEELQCPVQRPDVDPADHLYVLRLNVPARAGQDPAAPRNAFIDALRQRRIGASVHFIPLHLHPYYRDKYQLRPDDFPIAYREYLRMLSLPLNPRMSDGDVADVVDAVFEIAVAHGAQAVVG